MSCSLRFESSGKDSAETDGKRWGKRDRIHLQKRQVMTLATRKGPRNSARKSDAVSMAIAAVYAHWDSAGTAQAYPSSQRRQGSIE